MGVIVFGKYEKRKVGRGLFRNISGFTDLREWLIADRDGAVTKDTRRIIEG